jgi:SpoVK/Ycf46/Vps4 family AAA+-type ATPase
MPVNKKGEPPKETKKTEEENIFIPEEPRYSLDDIILTQATKDQILDVATYAENSQLVFEIWGFDKTHKYSKRVGINLYGAPGTGKTMAAHAIAKQLGKKILIVNYADIESKYVGETPKNIRKAFEAAKNSGSILFFDEADAILSKRVTNMTQAVDVSVNQTRSVMLMLMNEYQDFIIFATNFISNFDPAFMRRISVHVKFELPDVECRKKLWQMYIPAEFAAQFENLDIDELAEKFDGLSGSDISNAVLNAAFKAARLVPDGDIKNAALKARYKASYTNTNKLDKKILFDAVENILESKAANNGEI